MLLERPRTFFELASICSWPTFFELASICFKSLSSLMNLAIVSSRSDALWLSVDLNIVRPRRAHKWAFCPPTFGLDGICTEELNKPRFGPLLEYLIWPTMHR